MPGGLPGSLTTNSVAVKVPALLLPIGGGSTKCVSTRQSTSLVSCKQNGLPGRASKVTIVICASSDGNDSGVGIGNTHCGSATMFLVDCMRADFCLVDTLILGLEYVVVLGPSSLIFPKERRLPSLMGGGWCWELPKEEFL